MIKRVEHCFSHRGKRGSRGQAIVELSIIVVVLLFIVLAVVDFGRLISLQIRMASVAREAGRSYVADDDLISSGSAPTDIYNRVVSMVAPSELDTDGVVIFSILERIDPEDDTDYSDPDTYDDDYIEVVVQHKYDPSGKSWKTMVGAVGAKVARNPGSDSDVLPLDMLRISQRTVAVEIYHEKVFLTPVRSIATALTPDKDITVGSWGGPLYERAIF